jgi:hypothetical protein
MSGNQIDEAKFHVSKYRSEQASRKWAYIPQADLWKMCILRIWLGHIIVIKSGIAMGAYL